jgi:hypothetical protein
MASTAFPASTDILSANNANHANGLDGVRDQSVGPGAPQALYVLSTNHTNTHERIERQRQVRAVRVVRVPLEAGRRRQGCRRQSAFVSFVLFVGKSSRGRRRGALTGKPPPVRGSLFPSRAL